jgi:hypothetical protein
MGPSTAATRPLLGQTMKNEDAKMWAKSPNQSGVPAGFVRVEQVSDGFARVFNWVSITSALRPGTGTTQTISDVEIDSSDVLELDLALTARIPLPFGGISVGGGRVFTLEDPASVSGFGVRASVAPIAQLSIDFAHSWVSGELEEETMTTAITGTRTSLGATVLLWGYNQFRWGVAVARAWTNAEPYASSGYTWSLVGTMY